MAHLARSAALNLQPASGELRDAAWECVRVSVLALVSDYGQQTFSAMLVYLAPPRRPECECVRHLRLASLSLYLSCICVPACVRVYLWVSVSQSLLRMSWAPAAQKVAFPVAQATGPTDQATLAARHFRCGRN